MTFLNVYFYFLRRLSTASARLTATAWSRKHVTPATTSSRTNYLSNTAVRPATKPATRLTSFPSATALIHSFPLVVLRLETLWDNRVTSEMLLKVCMRNDNVKYSIVFVHIS